MSGSSLDHEPEALHVQSVRPRLSGGGSWVAGTIGSYRFTALVFAEHANNADWELGGRISKLWVQHAGDGSEVASYDRGWDVPPASLEVERIVVLLVKHLAAHVCGGDARVERSRARHRKG